MSHRKRVKMAEDLADSTGVSSPEERENDPVLRAADEFIDEHPELLTRLAQ